MTNKFHFIGIGGIGMSGLARILLSQNIPVTGSDIAVNPTIESLIQQGAIIHKGHAAHQVPPDSILVYSSDIPITNPEYQAAIELHCPLLHRSDLLADLMKGYQGLAVAGTHGKTTTSAILATVLIDANFNPSFAIGGVLPAYKTNAGYGHGDYFAFEADESDRSFLKYHPFGAIVTNIDNDHLINYEGSEACLVDAFKTFMSQVESSEVLFWCGDDNYLKKLNSPGQRYGFDPDCEWRIVSYRQEGFKTVFDLQHHDQSFEEIELALVGKHNALNAAAVFGLALTLGVPEQSIRQTLRSFKGVLRRCEMKGSYRGILFVDDYAHHPTEIKTTLEGICRAIGSQRLIAVFQPHRYSRTQDCLGQYGTIFDSADEVVLTDIYGAGEAPIPHLTSEVILREIEQSSSIACRYVPRSELSLYLSQAVQPNDVVVTLGAGDVTKVGTETLALLEKQAVGQLT